MAAKTAEISAEKQTQKNNLHMLVMLTAPAVMAWYYYGLRSLLLIMVCMASAAVCDFAGSLLIKSKKKQCYDYGAVLTGALIAMMLPASFPLTLAAAGCAFALIAAVLPFGGARSAPFVPAAAGFAFICVCRPEEVFNYPAVTAEFDLFSSVLTPADSGTSLAAMLHAGNSLRLISVNVVNALTGNFPGPLGGSVLVLIAASAYFLFTRPAALLNSLGMLLSCGAMALLFPRIFIEADILKGSLSSLTYELCAGSLVFAALFLLTDSATSPKKPLSRLLYGAFAGVLCMSLRYFGVFEEGVCYAVLLANAAWPLVQGGLNKLGERLLKPARKSAAPVSLKEGGGKDA